MGSKAHQINFITPNETRNCFVSFVDMLSTGELLTGTPTITANSTALTLANKAVSSGALTINGQTVATGKACTFNVTGGSAGNEYEITIQVGTDATPAQTLEALLLLRVETL